MSRPATQMRLFESDNLNPTYEIKRQIRIALAGSALSRDQVVDEMNRIAIREGMRKTVSKATLDNWTKDSDRDRLPSLPWLTIFCKVMNTTAPITVLVRPLGAEVIDYEDAKLLKWARAERDKKRAVKRARLAEQALEDL